MFQPCSSHLQPVERIPPGPAPSQCKSATCFRSCTSCQLAVALHSMSQRWSSVVSVLICRRLWFKENLQNLIMSFWCRIEETVLAGTCTCTATQGDRFESSDHRIRVADSVKTVAWSKNGGRKIICCLGRSNVFWFPQSVSRIIDLVKSQELWIKMF